MPAAAGLGFLRESAGRSSCKLWGCKWLPTCVVRHYSSPIEEQGNKMLPELKFPPVRI